MEARKQVMDYLRENLRREDIELTMHFREDLELDSLDMIDLAVFLEERVGDRVSDEELFSLATPLDVVEFLEKKGFSA